MTEEILIVFHPDCGGELVKAKRGDKFWSCKKCGWRVSARDRQRIIDPRNFIRPGAWVPLDPDPRMNEDPTL